MPYKCFISIEEVVGNYLMSFIIEKTYYLIIIESNIINLGFPLINQVNSYKHLILRI
jgi:hypothetical protein